MLAKGHEKALLWKVLPEPDSHALITAIYAKSMTSHPDHKSHKAHKIKEPSQNKALPERKACGRLFTLATPPWRVDMGKFCWSLDLAVYWTASDAPHLYAVYDLSVASKLGIPKPVQPQSKESLH